jgi:hypothetical protein
MRLVGSGKILSFLSILLQLNLDSDQKETKSRWIRIRNAEYFNKYRL